MSDLSIFKYNTILTQLRQDKANIAVVSSPELYGQLKACGIPEDRIAMLLSLALVGAKDGTVAIMTKRQYNYYRRQEDQILKEATC